jgi:hypothetical protein
MLLLLYVLGYVAANSHYARFEMIKPTLLAGRYLSAGLLYVAFAAAPAAAGFAAVLHAAARKRRLSDRANVRSVYLAYLLVVVLYALLLPTFTMIEPLLWVPWAFIAGATLIGANAALGIALGEDVPDRGARTLDRTSKLVTHALFMLGLAWSFGYFIYPWVRPPFGGAAVPQGYVWLKPEAPPALGQLLSTQPLPFVDLDERFLYVVACQRQAGRTHPGVIMVPLEFVAADGMRSFPDTLLAVPAYIKEHRCL